MKIIKNIELTIMQMLSSALNPAVMCLMHFKSVSIIHRYESHPDINIENIFDIEPSFEPSVVLSLLFLSVTQKIVVFVCSLWKAIPDGIMTRLD
jgi:hypothetical protein